MASEQLTIVLEYERLGVEAVIETIQAVLTRHSVPLNSDIRRIKAQRPKHLNRTIQNFEFDFGSVTKFKLDVLGITSAETPAFPWDDWVASLADHLVMAWVADANYEHWQNARDPLEYTAVGKPCAHLPMISNGLPFPLDQKIIDTSGNPGRRILREGYIEAVGSAMWLGDLFWARTGADKNSIIGAEWIQVTSVADSLIKLQAAEDCFTTSEGLAGDTQRRLRSLLFPSQASIRHSGVTKH